MFLDSFEASDNDMDVEECGMFCQMYGYNYMGVEAGMGCLTYVRDMTNISQAPNVTVETKLPWGLLKIPLVFVTRRVQATRPKCVGIMNYLASFFKLNVK